MKKFLLAFILLFVGINSLNLNAQQWGIGARMGYWDGSAFSLDVKKYNPSSSMEFIGTYYDNNNLEFTFLYQWKREFAENFNFYFGYGASVADYDHDLGVAFDGVLGVEWFIPYSPLTVAIDWIPQLRLIPETKFCGNFSFILKYTF